MVGTLVILKVVDWTVGLRVTEEEEGIQGSICLSTGKKDMTSRTKSRTVAKPGVSKPRPGSPSRS